MVEEEIISAVKAISSGHGLGLDNLLCSLATDWRVRAAIEWAMLERDILVSIGVRSLGHHIDKIQGLEPTVFEAFLCRCTLLSVHLTGNLAPGFGRVGVDRPSRAQHFSKLARERIEQRSNDPNAEMQDVALCRGLIRSVLDDESPPHCGLDLSWPANANLKRLPGLLGLDPTAVQFRGFDIYLEDDVNVKSLRNAICHYVPIGFTADIYKALPADLLNDLPYGTVDSALTMMYDLACWPVFSTNHDIGTQHSRNFHH